MFRLKLNKQDQIILDGIKKDCESSFDRLFKKYYQKLVYFSIRIVKDPDLANEIVQELFVSFWEKRHQLEPAISLQAYLYRAVYNNSIHSINKHKRFQKTDLSILKEAPEDFNHAMEATELEIAIFNQIEQLPDACKKIFKLSRFNEMKYLEIAEKLGISVKTVETQMSRALKFLRQHLEIYIKLFIMMLIQIK